MIFNFLEICKYEGVGPKNLTIPAHFILSPRPTPRRKKWLRTNKESLNSLETLPRTILFSAFQILEGKNGISSKAASQSAPRKRTSTVGHPWGYGVGAIQGETVTSALNAPNQRFGRINEEMTPEQCGLGCATHKGFGKVADGTSTRVRTCMTNRWRPKIDWKKICNVKDPPRMRDQES